MSPTTMSRNEAQMPALDTYIQHVLEIPASTVS